MKNRFLIISAGGLVGRELVRQGLKKGYDIYGTYNSNEVKGEKFFQLNVNDKDKLEILFEKIKPDFVIDTHAFHNVDECEDDFERAWEVNVVGVKNIAFLCSKYNSKLVFISTDYVFNSSENELSENEKPNPVNNYGKVKRIAEVVVESMNKDNIIVRPSVIYGVGGKGKTPFVMWLIKKLQNNEKVKIVNDQYSNPTLANNLVQVIYSLIEKNSNGLFHATGRENLNRYDFSLKVANIFGLKAELIMPISSEELNQKAIRPKKIIINTEKIETETEIKMLNVEEGLNILKNQLEVKRLL